MRRPALDFAPAFYRRQVVIFDKSIVNHAALRPQARFAGQPMLHALLLGANRPKVNAALGALENAGAIRRTSERIFRELAKLALAAQKNDD
jgi:hypothetical protein